MVWLLRWGKVEVRSWAHRLLDAEAEAWRSNARAGHEKGLGEFDQRRFSKVRLRELAFIVFIILFLWDQAKRD